MTVAPITVCIGTYGDRDHWSGLAHERAMPSVDRQTIRPENLIWAHDADLRRARNNAAAGARSDWLCFLDADDELDEHYLEAMNDVVTHIDGPALIQPATLGVHPDGHEDAHPVVIAARHLIDGNFMVIGTLIRRDQFERLDGFDAWPIYEDWDLWLRAWNDGAQLCVCSAAIYRVHVNPAGRNSTDRDTQLRVYNQIRRRHLTGAPR